MSRVQRFEDLIAWQKARVLTREIYQVSRAGAFAKDFGLAGQIQRASASIMSNIAEGHERTGSAEFHHFLSLAKGSCAEVRSLLYIAYDVGYIAEGEFKRLLAMTEELGRVIGGLRAAIQRRRRGSDAS